MDWKHTLKCTCGNDRLFAFVDNDRLHHLRCLECRREVRGKSPTSCLKHWNAGRVVRRRKQERPAILFGRRKIKGGPSRLVSRSSSKG
jgi:hypothetical protein